MLASLKCPLFPFTATEHWYIAVYFQRRWRAVFRISLSKTLACHCRSTHCSLINTDFHRFSHKPSSFGLVSLSKREQLLRRTVQWMVWTFDTRCSEGKRKRSIISVSSKDTDLGKDWPVNGHNIGCIEEKRKRAFDWLHALGPDCIFKVDTIRCKWALGHWAGLGPLRKSILHVF